MFILDVYLLIKYTFIFFYVIIFLGKGSDNMNNKGFISSTLIYSFIILFISLLAAIIGTYVYYHGIIFSNNRDITNSLNDRIESQYVTISNLLQNSGFEEPIDPSTLSNSDDLAEVHYDGSKAYKLDPTIDNWVNDNRYAYRYVKDTSYSGDYALMLGNYNYSEIYQQNGQDYTYIDEVGIQNVKRVVSQNVTDFTQGTHYLYFSAKVFRNGPTDGTSTIKAACNGGCTITGTSTIDISGGYSDWKQVSMIFEVSADSDVNTLTISLESDNSKSGTFILVDELLLTDVTKIIDATMWTPNEAKTYFDGAALNPDNTINNRYRIDYFEGSLSYELFENIQRVKITFDNGTDVPETSITIVSGKNITYVDPPTRENYTFLGYFSRPNGLGTQYFDRLGHPNESEYINKDMTLYAFWTNELFYFPYTGRIVRILLVEAGEYRIEAWGAQGGSVTTNGKTYTGGYGGYSVGIIDAAANTYLYIGAGQKGSDNNSNSTRVGASFNGGGGATCSAGTLCSGGGGATHVAYSDGILSSFESDSSNVILVAGGGGGAIYKNNTGKNGGSGGGYIGAGATTSENGGTQSSGFGFGHGESGNENSGSGGGYYGGVHSNTGIGTGGSGYINSSTLTDRSMYCYNCQTSDIENTYTLSTNSISGKDVDDYEPLSNSAKKGNGYVKVIKLDNSLVNYIELLFDGNAPDADVTPKSMWFFRGSIYGVLPTATREGYEFLGWYTEPEGGTKISENDTVTLESSQTLYAHWGLGTYTVEFDANGGVVSPTSKEVMYTESYGDLPNPSRNGYTFDGWYTDANTGTKVISSTTVTTGHDHKIYAHWIPNQYKVSFDANGGSVNTTSIDVTFDKAYGVLPVATRDQYNFIGWYTEKTGGTEITSSSIYEVVGNQTLYAHWSNRKYNFKVTGDSHVSSFNIKVGTDAPLNNQRSYNQSIPFGTEFAISNISIKTGYHYNGYTKSGAVQEITSSDTSTLKFKTSEGDASVTLQSAPNTFTIKYRAGSGSGSMGTQKCTYDQNCTLSSNAFYRSGYTFAYWLGSNGKTYSNRANVKNILSSNGSTITLTAQWTRNSSGGSSGGGGGGGGGVGGGTYTIKFHNTAWFANDSKMGTQTCYVNSYCTLKKNKFTNQLWSFVGWLTPDNKVYSDQARVYNLARSGQTITLTARWYFPGLGYTPR